MGRAITVTNELIILAYDFTPVHSVSLSHWRFADTVQQGFVLVFVVFIDFV
jgi:hypothetical protein